MPIINTYPEDWVHQSACGVIFYHPEKLLQAQLAQDEAEKAEAVEQKNKIIFEYEKLTDRLNSELEEMQHTAEQVKREVAKEIYQIISDYSTLDYQPFKEKYPDYDFMSVGNCRSYLIDYIKAKFGVKE